MTITTKYNVGDTVWTIANDKVIQAKIVKPNLSTAKSLDDLGWELDTEHMFWGYPLAVSRLESELFPSK